MLLLGSLCALGLGTLLITELPRHPDQAAELISTALVLVGGIGAIAGMLFVVLAPLLSARFQLLIKNGLLDMLIFAAGVSLTAMALVLDQALVGLLRGDLQLWRNALFAITKLLLVFVAGLWLLSKTGIAIYTTWALGNLLALASLSGFTRTRGHIAIRAHLPRWEFVQKLGKAALQHQMLNITLQAPALLLPVLVTALLSVKANAWFYVAWMLANFAFVIPTALTTVLHALNAAYRSALGHKVRTTLVHVQKTTCASRRKDETMMA
jgi:O-antigen/teichoic acid export membrane protein